MLLLLRLLRPFRPVGLRVQHGGVGLLLVRLHVWLHPMLRLRVCPRSRHRLPSKLNPTLLPPLPLLLLLRLLLLRLLQ